MEVTSKSIMMLLLVFVALLLDNACSQSEEASITCEDIKNGTYGIGSLAIKFSSPRNGTPNVQFYLSTNERRNLTEISQNDWSALELNGFDPSKRTILIIHGYRATVKKPWAEEMKDGLLDYESSNIIMVDWAKESKKFNYVNAARNTVFIAKQIINFLQTMKPAVEQLNTITNENMWNHLYFIGHSLGAHICGQAAHLLKGDEFWKVERITGLDPAKPCFAEINPGLRLDKDDADFVDIIHTQGGGGAFTTLGLADNIGHVDFYVNGGELQPGCSGKGFWKSFYRIKCSHQMAYRVFTQSLKNIVRGKCKYVGHPWNGYREEAEHIFETTVEDVPCTQCPELGINANKSEERGKFLVIVSGETPYCGNIADNSNARAELLDIINQLREAPN